MKKFFTSFFISLLVFLGMGIGTLSAHEEETPEEAKGLIESCGPGGQCGVVGDFSWDVMMSQPTTTHQIDYIATYWYFPNVLWISIGVGIFFLLLWSVFLLLKKKSGEPFTLKEESIGLAKTLISYGFVMVIAYGIFSYYMEQADKGIVVCGPDGCTISRHIHAEIHINVCGESVTIPKETGKLNMAHSHKESDIIHWHDTEPYDKETGVMLDTSELTLGAFLTQIEHTFDGQCFDDICAGAQQCNGEPGAWKLFVDKELNEELHEYVWDDGQVLHLRFQEESNNEYPEGLDWGYSGP